MTTGWRYRIVKKEGKYGFHPVFIDGNNDIVNINDMPAIYADSLAGLLKEENIMKEAWDYPVINYDTGEEL